MAARAPTTTELGDEIFRLVEADQGKAFVSDGLGAVKSSEELFGIVRGHLFHTERAARIMRKWLKQYGEI